MLFNKSYCFFNVHTNWIGQRVELRLNQWETNSVENGRGVKQGCCMSPILFNLYGEYLRKEALAEVRDFNIGGRITNKGATFR